MKTVYFCEKILDSPNHKNRGVGAFTRDIKKNFKNTTNIYDKECNTVVFTCTPPVKNNKPEIWEYTFNLLKVTNEKIEELTITKTPEKNENYWFDDYQQEGDIYTIPGGNTNHMNAWKIVKKNIRLP